MVAKELLNFDEEAQANFLKEVSEEPILDGWISIHSGGTWPTIQGKNKTLFS